MTIRAMFRSLCLATAMLLPLMAATPAAAQRSSDLQRGSKRVLEAFREVVAVPRLSTVRVLCNDEQVALGVIVSEDGYILTKASELQADPLCKLPDNRVLPARVIGTHDGHDLALLKVDATRLRPIRWGKSSDALVGGWVASVSPDSLPVAIGVVSVGTRKVTTRDLPRSATPRGGYLGVSLEEGDTGIRITRVLPDTAAAKAGLKENDEIVGLSGAEINNVEKLIESIQKMRPGQKVALRVLRDDRKVDVTVTLGKRPAELNRGDFQNQLGSKLSERRGGFSSILQHDTVIRPEDCGGPLVDLDGNAVGINIARAGRTESYAIPSEAILEVLPALKAGKLAPKD